ncbi:gfo/Idh/MocA family oxidoreductase, partial [Pseudomonas syringae]
GSSRREHGNQSRLSVATSGSKGTRAVDQERRNELHLYRTGTAAGGEGLQRLLAGPAQPGYAAFGPAPGHQLGYNELKAREVQALIQAVCGQRRRGPDFEEAWQIERLATAIRVAAAEQRWVALDDI